MSTHGFATFLAIVAGVMAFPVSTRAQEFAWKEENGAVGLMSGPQTIWRFHYGADQPKPCFHPVALPGGEPLTDFRPADHPWHRALWFSWKFINPAFDYTGVPGGRECGIAILDHPKNPNAPTPWYAIHGAVMHYFSPAVICYEQMHLKKDATLRLRYRVILHRDRWDAPRLAEAAAAFSSVPPSRTNPQ